MLLGVGHLENPRDLVVDKARVPFAFEEPGAGTMDGAAGGGIRDAHFFGRDADDWSILLVQIMDEQGALSG
ncbi:hypothetical protein BFW01_g12757 [Lasiodiplodia theobromae]|nr:hypothetical protein BFW01_g12757 [Lasiodiplodia theobromae]